LLGSRPKDAAAAEAFLRALGAPEAKTAYVMAGFELKQ
jgi:hypothetical protein